MSFTDLVEASQFNQGGQSRRTFTCVHLPLPLIVRNPMSSGISTPGLEPPSPKLLPELLDGKVYC